MECHASSRHPEGNLVNKISKRVKGVVINNIIKTNSRYLAFPKIECSFVRTV